MENNLTVHVPAKYLEVGKKVKLVLACDPKYSVNGSARIGKWTSVELLT